MSAHRRTADQLVTFRLPLTPRRCHRHPSQAHLTRVSALSGPGTRPGIRPVIRHRWRRSQPLWSRFPAAFRPPALACRVILFPPGNWAFLTVGLPGHKPGPGRGFHVPHQRDTTGMGASSTPGTAVLSLTGCRARPAPAASQRPVPAPRTHIPSRGYSSRGINGGSRDSSVRPAPRL